jgi:predicted ribosomally synthesized peptide with SipW-like signal peptide
VKVSMRKSKLALSILVLLGALLAGNTTAYFSDNASMADVTFSTGTVRVSFTGDPTVDAPTDYVQCQRVTWTIANEGSNTVFLRAKPRGEMAEAAAGGMVNLAARPGEWQLGEDGYFYYAKPLEREDTTELCLEVTFTPWRPVKLPVKLEVEAIQEANDALGHTWPNSPYN